MKKEFKEVNFENKNKQGFYFDFVTLEEMLTKAEIDHNQFEYHKIGFYLIFLVTENEGVYNLNFKDYHFKKATLFTLRKDSIHKFYKNKAKGVLLVFTENFIVNHSNKLEASKIFLLFNEMLASQKLQLNEVDYNEIIVLINLIKEEYFGVNDNYSPNIVRGLVQVIITKLFRIKSKDNFIFDKKKYLSTFMDFQELVEKNCFKYKKVTFFADKMGITTKTLNNVTQRVVHKSAKSVINDIVIIHSKRLIINSQNSLTEIAYKIGFDEPTNFFKYFKKYTGVSPSQFRKTYQA